MDRSCLVQLLAEAAGQPRPIDAISARDARARIGTPGIARLNFRPMYAAIVQAHPDLLD
jgi:hypothetical protein